MININNLPFSLINQLNGKNVLFSYKSKIRRNPTGLLLFVFGIIWTSINLFFISELILPLIKYGTTDFTFNEHPITVDWHHLDRLFFPVLLPLGFSIMGFVMLWKSYAYFIKDDIIFVAIPDAILFHYRNKVESFPWDAFDDVSQIRIPWQKGIVLHFKQQNEFKTKKIKDQRLKLWLPNPPDLQRIYRIIENNIKAGNSKL